MKRLNSSTSASVPRSGGCNAFGRKDLRTDAKRRKNFAIWKKYAQRILALNRERPDLTLDELVLACASGEFLEAAARSRDFSLATALLLKKPARRQSSRPHRAFEVGCLA